MKIRELPTEVILILDRYDAPLALRKHLQIVYSTASVLTHLFKKEWPAMKIDYNQVLLGAAIHDIGKIKFPNELHEPGDMHLKAGYDILIENNFPENIAEIALVHEDWNSEQRKIEELLVSLSDLIWNGIRNNILEEKIIKYIADAMSVNYWDIYVKADKIITEIADSANSFLKIR